MIPGLGRSPGEGSASGVLLVAPVFWPGEFHGLYSPWDHKVWSKYIDPWVGKNPQRRECFWSTSGSTGVATHSVLQCSGLENSMGCIVHGIAKYGPVHYTIMVQVWTYHGLSIHPLKDIWVVPSFG